MAGARDTSPHDLFQAWLDRGSDLIMAGDFDTWAGSVELPLIISDHADWDDLQASILATGCEELWVTHGAENALVHWAGTKGLRARPLHMVGYGEEEEEAAPAPTSEAKEAAP